jgi:hypothetical protein
MDTEFLSCSGHPPGGLGRGHGVALAVVCDVPVLTLGAAEIAPGGKKEMRIRVLSKKRTIQIVEEGGTLVEEERRD